MSSTLELPSITGEFTTVNSPTMREYCFKCCKPFVGNCRIMGLTNDKGQCGFYHYPCFAFSPKESLRDSISQTRAMMNMTLKEAAKEFGMTRVQNDTIRMQLIPRGKIEKCFACEKDMAYECDAVYLIDKNEDVGTYHAECCTVKERDRLRGEIAVKTRRRYGRFDDMSSIIKRHADHLAETGAKSIPNSIYRLQEVDDTKKCTRICFKCDKIIEEGNLVAMTDLENNNGYYHEKCFDEVDVKDKSKMRDGIKSIIDDRKKVDDVTDKFNLIDAMQTLQNIISSDAFSILRLRMEMKCETAKNTVVRTSWTSVKQVEEAVAELGRAVKKSFVSKRQTIRAFFASAEDVKVFTTNKEIKSINGITKDRINYLLNEDLDTIKMVVICHIGGTGQHFTFTSKRMDAQKTTKVVRDAFLGEWTGCVEKYKAVETVYKKRHSAMFPVEYLPKMENWQQVQAWALGWISQYVHGKQMCQMCGKKGIHKCSLCWVNRYCSKECQSLHWSKGGHKITCKFDLYYADAVRTLSEMSVTRLSAVPTGALACPKASSTADPE